MAGRPDPPSPPPRAISTERQRARLQPPRADASVVPLTSLDMAVFGTLTVVDRVTLRPPQAAFASVMTPSAGEPVVDTAVEASGFTRRRREGTLIGPSTRQRQKEETSKQAALRDARAAEAKRRAVGPATYMPKFSK
eukprot:CAMPEP_0174853136 /NCGR_PEP_ID=MMETSP1114-20130205/27379_1 /TAXON_ID=312471 /ORGANISM="Neobodo designis, Strain CCAP 1951/1" /LENGTH=136 /DNA_ID=CAMNT_0016087757 /DNA_START=30 /DNA_END=440 /DNA_ORIENTATION=+